ncbi:meprin A subunit alpha [Pseudophryne corroboree]|uniref:meprin A subunit alpha n=1 Tax=Pseudophryne corroboree TaxID=495146 RepID=UPI00308160DA
MSLKIQVMDSHLECEAMSDEHSERFHRDISTMEGGYQDQDKSNCVLTSCKRQKLVNLKLLIVQSPNSSYKLLRRERISESSPPRRDDVPSDSQAQLPCHCICELVGFYGISPFSFPQIKERPNDFEDAGDFIDIPDLNKDQTLFQGDIKLPNERNALRNESYRWKFPIPYILADNLDLNAKAVILNAFDMFRLKSCVDFKPYEKESTFLHFQKFGGCWSYVGDFHTGQDLSIGSGCDHKAIVEHEILHALGFYHEQSRTDRDDYVEVWWDQITDGMGHNFNTYDDNYITDLNTPYDYESVMHYGPYSFNKDPDIPTITAKIPAFNNIIGQRLDFSEIDLERLNRMYDCTTPLLLLDQCSFEYINICGMVQGTTDDDDWVHELSTSESFNDHTLGGRCRDSGYFMYLKTNNGPIGKTAVLESRILYPKKTEQCLQFFYKMDGSPKDKLTVWTRTDDGTGTVRKLRKIETIQGDNNHDWKIAHVPLNVNRKFRYMFQGIQGDDQTTNGGIFIDDISLTELPCPSSVWTIRNFSKALEETVKGDRLVSPCFYSPDGYGYGIGLYPHGQNNSAYVGYTGISFHLCSGEDDAALDWPVLNYQAMITLVDQDPDVRLRMSSSRSFTTSADQIITALNISRWERPSKTGTWDPSCNCYRTTDFGWATFITHFNLHRRSFLKNDDLIVFVEFTDLTHLIKTEVPIQVSEPLVVEEEKVNDRSKRSLEDPRDSEGYEIQPLEAQCDDNPCLNGGVCVVEKGRANCRCASSQAFYYTGMQCETAQLHGNVLGMMIGGVAGTIALTISVLAVMSRR